MEILNLQTTYLLLGSNLGNREEILEKAIQEIEEKIGVIDIRSKFYETTPWGLISQPDFLNIAIAVDTALNPYDLLQQTQMIEESLGRVRKEKWGARLIDIDIIFYGNQEVSQIDLIIPHPFMQERNFVLAPLREIAPDFVHPILGKSLQVLYDTCADIGEVKVLNAISHFPQNTEDEL
jgi:2-amino-4-hydroxy-6-hydroxymethyldihydropteridine diphosphokinase